jgi:hypothetical protein
LRLTVHIACAAATSGIDVGNGPAEAMRQRTKLSEASDPEPVPVATTKGTPLKEALEKYLSDLEALGREAYTISTYRRDITPFVKGGRTTFGHWRPDQRQNLAFSMLADLRSTGGNQDSGIYLSLPAGVHLF